MKPKKINASIYVDDRGFVIYSNNFDMRNIKRFYIVNNINTSIIRAFHGHMKEKKYAMVIKGTAFFIIAKIKTEKKLEKPEKFIISSKKPEILFIPPKYANGFRSLEDGTVIIFFSSSTLKESKKDDYRFPWNYFGKEIWEIENR